MTEHVDPLQEVLNELRELRQSFEAGIAALTSTGDGLDGVRADLKTTNAKSDRRARWFRNMWIAGTSAFLIAVCAGVVYDLRAHNENVTASRRQDCFQLWSNATSQRTQTLAAASEARIDALDHALDVRAHFPADSPRSKAAIAAAAAAGDTYERVAEANPPIPPLQAFCSSQQVAGGPSPSPSAAGNSSAGRSGAVGSIPRSSGGQSPSANANATPQSASTSAAASTATATRTAPAVIRTRRSTVTRTASPPQTAPSPTRTAVVPGLLCPVVNTRLICSSETP